MNQLLQKIGERVVGMQRGLLLNPPPGHYYSPIVNKAEVIRRADELFAFPPRSLPGLNLNEAAQLRLLDAFRTYYADLPFPHTKQPNQRYYYINGFYCQADGVFLYSMIRHFAPKRIVEIGSGFSSACMLDTLDSLGRTDTSLTFIDPHPDRLLANLRPADHRRCTIIKAELQRVSPAVFANLDANDMLFVDSTHVSKTGSDVNRIVFELLPALRPGVLVHVHDIFYPFEYPRDWVLSRGGFGWNEAYLLRAFLSYNAAFSIVAFNTFLETFHTDWFAAHMPVCLENQGGSIWLQRAG